jgi:hypothetical protein
MHQLFVSLLEGAKANYQLLRGGREERLANARTHVDALLD